MNVKSIFGLKNTVVPTLLLCLMFQQAYAAPTKKFNAGKFSLDYTIVQGYGEISTHLIIEGHNATLLRYFAVPETEGAAIGIYRHELSDSRLMQLANAITIPFSPAPGLEPDMDHIYFRLKSDGRNAEGNVPCTPAGILHVQNFVSEVGKLQEQLLKSPYRTLRMELLPLESRPIVGHPYMFKVIIHNSGIEPIQLRLDNTILWLETTLPPVPAQQDVTPLPVVWSHVSSKILGSDQVHIKGRGQAAVNLQVTLKQAITIVVRTHYKNGEAADALSVPGDTISNSHTFSFSGNLSK